MFEQKERIEGGGGGPKQSQTDRQRDTENIHSELGRKGEHVSALSSGHVYIYRKWVGNCFVPYDPILKEMSTR